MTTTDLPRGSHQLAVICSICQPLRHPPPHRATLHSPIPPRSPAVRHAPVLGHRRRVAVGAGLDGPDGAGLCSAGADLTLCLRPAVAAGRPRAAPPPPPPPGASYPLLGSPTSRSWPTAAEEEEAGPGANLPARPAQSSHLMPVAPRHDDAGSGMMETMIFLKRGPSRDSRLFLTCSWRSYPYPSLPGHLTLQCEKSHYVDIFRT